MSLHHGGRGPGHVSRWPKAVGGTPTPSARTLLVGNRMGVPSSSASGSPAGGVSAGGFGLTMRSQSNSNAVASDFTNLKIAFCTLRQEVTTGETAWGNTADFKAGIEVGGTTYTVAFGGNRTKTIADGAVAFSDAISGLTLAASTTFYTRYYVTVPAGGKMALGLGTNNSAGFYRRNGQLTGTPSAGTDIADNTSTTGFAAQGNQLQPLCMIGDTTDTSHKAVIIVGHSFDSGEGDGVGDANAYRGYIERQLGANVAWAQFGKGGANLYQYLAGGTTALLAVAPYATSAIIGRWDNDLYLAAQTEANTKQKIIDMASALVGANATIACFTRTAPPRTTSTDSWATAGNQTISNTTNNTRRININNWIRDGLPISAGAPVAVGTVGALRAGDVGHPYKGYFEIADLIEVNSSNALTRDAGLIYCGAANNTAHTADGTHPNPTGHALLAPGIVLATLQ